MPDRLAGRLHRLAAADLAAEPDAALLDRFAAGPDDAPFAELVRRHGPMVLGVCRRIVGPADADDAFQAAFLVLARKAAAVRGRPVGGWLYRVAGHVARRHRDQLRRRLRHERAVAKARRLVAPTTAADDLAAVLDDELGRLPEAERAAVVACLVEGRTQDAAARDLGWSFSTLRRRLDRGKELLRDRLTRRGVAAPAGLVGVVLVEPVPPALADLTRVGAVGFARGVKTATPAVTLAEGVLTMSLRTKFAALAGVVAAAGLTVGTGWALQPGPRAEAPAGRQNDPAKALPAPAADGRIRPSDRLLITADNVFEAAPIKGVYTVEPGGEVSLGPAYGRARVAGLTFREAERSIHTALSPLFRQPETVRVAVTVPGPEAPPKAPDGRLRPGDRVTISVVTELGQSVAEGLHVLEPGGKVSFGTFGRVDLAGKTFEEAEAAVRTHMEKHYRNPTVVVTAHDAERGSRPEERVRRLEQEVAGLKRRVEGKE